jgi:carbamoyl-phosphate synthase large subunit
VRLSLNHLHHICIQHINVNFSINSECEADPSLRKKIIILGGGPNRIGQGIEFDYCCCQAAFSLKDAGFETIMVNCNPETVSTDYDTSDRLYFEPLKEEYVFNIIKKEKEKRKLSWCYCAVWRSNSN